MGRRRKYPQVVLLRVFNEGEKLTEEQKAWLLSKGDSNDKSIRREKKGLCDYSERNS